MILLVQRNGLIFQLQVTGETRFFETPLPICMTSTHLEFFGFMVASKAGRGLTTKELPVQALVYYDATMHKGNSLDKIHFTDIWATEKRVASLTSLN